MNFQPFDYTPNILPTEWLDKSVHYETKCKVGSCPVIGSFPPSNVYTQTMVFKDPNETHRALVVLDFPPNNLNSFWISPKGKFLMSIIHQQRPEGMSVAVGYLTKCLPPGRALSKEKFVLQDTSVAYCGAHIYDEIHKYDPNVVILMGTEPAQAFLGKNKSLYQLRKDAHIINYGDKERITLATISPNHVAAQPYQGSVVRVDLAKAFYWGVNGIDTYNAFKRRPQTVVYESTDDGIKQFEEKIDQLIASGDVVYTAWDTETESLSKSANRLYSFGFTDSPYCGYAINYDHPRSVWTDKQKVRIAKSIYKLGNAPNVKMISHNTQFDLSIIEISLKFKVKNNLYNTMAMAHGLEEEFSSKEYQDKAFPKHIPAWKGLDNQTSFWYDFDDPGWKNMKKMRASLAALETYKVDEYCAMDCCNTLKNFYCLHEALKNKSPTSLRSITELATPIDYVLSHIEQNGIPVDDEQLEFHMNETLENSASWILKKLEIDFLTLPTVKKLNALIVKGMAKPPLFGARNYVNLNSHDNMKALFYDLIGHEPIELLNKKTHEMETKYPTDKDFLDNLVEEKAPGYVEAAALKEFRQFSKLHGTFITGFRENANLHWDHRVRASYHGSKTVTYRLSSSKPNAQQIPRSGEKDNKAKGFVKKLIKAPDGYALVSSDYGTAEVRKAAIAAHDEVLAETFNNANKLKETFILNPSVESYEKLKFEGDAHRANASAAYSVPIRQVTKDQRQAAKNVSFLCIYSANPAPQLAAKIDCSVEEAQEIINNFLGKLEKLGIYLKSRDVLIENYGIIMTPFGRTRSLYAAMFPENKKEYSHAINQGRNTGIQSSSSDMLLLACYKLINYIDDNNKDWKIVNVVHDSVLAQIPIPEIEEFAKVLANFMDYPGLDKFGFDPEFCALASDFEIGINYGYQVGWDGTSQHMARIQKWLEQGADKDSMPASYFDQHLDLNGKYEKLKEEGMDTNKIKELEIQLSEIKHNINLEYVTA